MGVGDKSQAPPFLTLGKRPGTPSTGSWVDHMAGVNGCGKSHFHRAGRREYRLSYAGPFVREL